MVQTINDPFSGNIFGRIGHGVGQGLSEQIPKEVERGRLSSGIRKIAQNPNSNPLEILADTYSLPGMTPELANAIRNFAQAQNFKKQTLPKEEPAPRSIPSPKPDFTGEQPVDFKFASSEEILEGRGRRLKAPDQRAINELASLKLSQGLATDLPSALSLADNELNRNRTAQREGISDFRNLVGERARTLTQSIGNNILSDYPDIEGEIQKSLTDQGEHLITDRGYTAEEADKVIGDVALDLAKRINKLKESASGSNLLKSTKDIKTNLKSSRNAFKNYGLDEVFDNIAAGSYGVSPSAIAKFVDPLENKSILKELANPAQGTKNRDAKLMAVIEEIKPSDNIFSIENMLYKKGYDVSRFRSLLQKAFEEGKHLTKRQERQMQKDMPGQKPLSDIIFELLF